MSVPRERSLATTQTAVNFMVDAAPAERKDAFELFAETILDRFQHPYQCDAASEILSRELPLRFQRYAAAWMLLTLTRNPKALSFDNTEAQFAQLLDRTFFDVYEQCGISERNQTYLKVNALTDFGQGILDELELLVKSPLELGQINTLQGNIQRLLGHGANRHLLGHLFPVDVAHRDRISNLFRPVARYSADVAKYTATKDIDLITAAYNACDACDEFENEVASYGGEDAERILGGLARQLKASVTNHFQKTEVGRPPRISFMPIAKKFPLRRVGTTIAIKVRVTNDGTAPARDLQLDNVNSDGNLSFKTSTMTLGNINAGESFVFDIMAEVTEKTEACTVEAELSSTRLGERIEHPLKVFVDSQRENIDWEQVETREPYSLDAVASDTDLVGRRSELLQLMRLIRVPTVGSGFIHGQKRVGKTSLANAAKDRLEKLPDEKWTVIYRGSGDFWANDAISMLKRMGITLANSIRQAIPQMSEMETPDFSDGISPLSEFVDEALRHTDKLLFIIDEFDDIHPELLRKSDTISSSLFMPIRQISTKIGCGFILVGGEGMQQIVTQQGDKLNKFSSVKVDYFSRSEHWSDFSTLITDPVQDWLEISDTALEKLYESSAGNPYFAKTLASQLSLDMVENRFTNASEVDMENAIARRCFGIEANAFGHFWSDGVIENAHNKNEIVTIRQLVLIALGKAFRRSDIVTYRDVWQEFQAADFTRIGEERFGTTVQDFLQRKILEENERRELSFSIPLFKAWLMDKGVEDLIPTGRSSEMLAARIRREEEVRVKDEEILNFAERISYFTFKGEPIDRVAIRRWLNQFDSFDDQRLMFKILERTRFYDATLMRSKMREMMSIVERGMQAERIIGRERARRGILLSTLDSSIAKGGYTYCKIFADEHNILLANAMPLGSQMEHAFDNDRSQRLLLVDDFAGSGNTLVKGLDRARPILSLAKEKGIRVTLCAVAGFSHAKEYVEKYVAQEDLGVEVHFCDILSTEDQIFSENSTIFPETAERARAKEIVEGKWDLTRGISPMGYEDTQAAVVFFDSCPNNTLPIFWASNENWTPLFRRKGSSLRSDTSGVGAA